jgi:hypothetical protein
VQKKSACFYFKTICISPFYGIYQKLHGCLFFDPPLQKGVIPDEEALTRACNLLI